MPVYAQLQLKRDSSFLYVPFALSFLELAAHNNIRIFSLVIQVYVSFPQSPLLPKRAESRLLTPFRNHLH